MTTRLLGLCGSLRSNSWNAALLRAAAELAPNGTAFETTDLHDIPLYDQDHDELAGGSSGTPTAVITLRERIAWADGLVISSPEHNWSFSAAIKNALDWCSRPAFASVLQGRPTLLLGASGGPAGTGRAQLHLRQVLLSTRTPVLLDSVQLGNAADCIDASGRLHHQPTRDHLAALLAELALTCGEDRSTAAVGEVSR
ncbi:NADPH-dependent FMN reductase [Streptomyces sp. NPDC007148]|uniref:NADPH-dependent FMN reductase n=1 Tax=Streptomyces sp. NPDC007148 TaxID=3364775 RepID=UPI0036919067